MGGIEEIKSFSGAGETAFLWTPAIFRSEESENIPFADGSPDLQEGCLNHISQLCFISFDFNASLFNELYCKNSLH